MKCVCFIECVEKSPYNMWNMDNLKVFIKNMVKNGGVVETNN